MDKNCNVRELYSRKEDHLNLHNLDEFGFIVDEPRKTVLMAPAGFRLFRAEWHDILDKYEFDRSKLIEQIIKRRLLQRGIPLLLRSRVWCAFLKSTSKFYIRLGISNNSINMEKRKEYKILAQKPSSYEYQIHVDIQRTFRHHYLFSRTYGKGQQELFNILVAFANLDTRIGYCQGMSDIAAIFLMHYTEFEAFKAMSEFFKRNKLFNLFDKKFTGMPFLIKIQARLLQKTVPKVYKLISAEIEIVLVSWFLTLFTRFDIKLSLRIWDFMMLYGFSSCLYFVCAIFKVHEQRLIALHGEALIQALNKLETEKVDVNEVVDLAFNYIESNGIKPNFWK
ncbi:hypothetical protein GINT2_002225 [Glugoides intestinalis]